MLEALEDRTLPTVWHVAAFGGNDSAGIGSPMSPFQSVQRAVDLAGTGDVIKVAQGRYTYDPARDGYFGSLGTRTVVTVFQKQIAVIGSYTFNPDPVNFPGAVTNWDTPALEGDTAPRSSIDGGGIARGVLVTSTPGGPRAGMALQNFFVENGVGGPITLRGGVDATLGKGGGMLAEWADPLVIRNVTFRNNVAFAFGENDLGDGGAGLGGGLAVLGGVTWPRVGPSVAEASTAVLTLENVTFSHNQALGANASRIGGPAQGGALFTDKMRIQARDVTFSGNLARGGTSLGGGFDPNVAALVAAAIGGAAHIIGSPSSSSFTDTIAVNNLALAGNAPGGVAGSAFGGAIVVELGSLNFVGGTFRGNTAQAGDGVDTAGGFGSQANGGAFQVTNGNLTIRGALIDGNSALGGDTPDVKGSANGGGIHHVNTLKEPNVIQLIEVALTDNVVAFGNGAAELDGGGGGGASFNGATVLIRGSRIEGNRFENAEYLLQGQAVAANNPSGITTIVFFSDTFIADHTNDLVGLAAAVHIFPGNAGNFTRVVFDGNTRDTNADNHPFLAGVFFPLPPSTGGRPGSGRGDSTGSTRVPLPLAEGTPPGDNFLLPQTLGTYEAASAAGGPPHAAWHLRFTNDPTDPRAIEVAYGGANWKPVVGDWDGNGITTLGAVDPGGQGTGSLVWHLRNSNTPGPADHTFPFGLSSWVPLAGDWDGDGTDTPAVVDTTGWTSPFAMWYLRDGTVEGASVLASYAFGLPGWVPVAGDWDGDGLTTAGLFDPGTATWHLRESNDPADPRVVSFRFGVPGWAPTVGDWDGDGITTVGVVDPFGNWHLRNANSPGTAGAIIPFGLGGWIPIAGSWGVEETRLAADEDPPETTGFPLSSAQSAGVVSADRARLERPPSGSLLGGLAASRYDDETGHLAGLDHALDGGLMSDDFEARLGGTEGPDGVFGPEG